MQISLSVDAEDTLCPLFMEPEFPLIGENALHSEVYEWEAINKEYYNVHNKTNTIHRKHYPFTKEEDEYLKELVKVYGDGNWKKIANKMQGRSPRQVRKRYNSLLKKRLYPYTISEDEEVIILGEERNNNCKAMAETIKEKTPKLGRKRHYSKLKNEEPLKLITDAGNRGSSSKTSQTSSLKLKRLLIEEAKKTNTLKSSIEILKEQIKELNIGLGKVGIMLDKLRTTTK